MSLLDLTACAKLPSERYTLAQHRAIAAANVYKKTCMSWLDLYLLALFFALIVLIVLRFRG